MRLFTCPRDGHLLYFENTSCERCGTRLGYLAEQNLLTTVERQGDSQRFRCDGVEGEWRYCDNAVHDACNWMIPADQEEPFCTSCRHNRTIPDLTVPGNLLLWQRTQMAQHRLIYSLQRLKLPLENRNDAPDHGLVFEILADPLDPAAPKVMTGHDEGIITLALSEADDAERVKRRTELGEPYRTLLGHFRHEVGHYYWDRLVRDGRRLAACRQVFGDDTKDYMASLQRHYAEGPPQGWQQDHVSAYATTHPWEDFAETWAHYLHITDTLEMARAFGLGIAPKADKTGDMQAEIDFNPWREGDIARMVEAWLALTCAVNSLNRCMGVQDLYPFVLTPTVIDKLGFIHDLVHGRVPQDRAAEEEPAEEAQPAPVTSEG